MRYRYSTVHHISGTRDESKGQPPFVPPFVRLLTRLDPVRPVVRVPREHVRRGIRRLNIISVLIDRCAAARTATAKDIAMKARAVSRLCPIPAANLTSERNRLSYDRTRGRIFAISRVRSGFRTSPLPGSWNTVSRSMPRLPRDFERERLTASMSPPGDFQRNRNFSKVTRCWWKRFVTFTNDERKCFLGIGSWDILIASCHRSLVSFFFQSL